MVHVMSEVQLWRYTYDGMAYAAPSNTQSRWVSLHDFKKMESQLDAQRLRADTAEAERDDALALAGAWKEQERLRGIQAINASSELAAAEQRIAEMVELLNLADHYLQADSFSSTGDVIEHTQEMRDEFRKKIAAALNPKPEAGSHE
jgi:conjugal transfer/entry exclusion protein